MSRSKLEVYGDILKVLADEGPLSRIAVRHKTKVDGELLKKYLAFLLQQGLVERQTIRKQAVFAVSKSGVKVLLYFKKLNPDLPMVERPQAVLNYL